jgi:hypothetical protein
MEVVDKVIQFVLPHCEHKFQMLDEVLPFFSPGLYKYRGHADTSWSLSTTLERLNERFRVPLPEDGLQRILLEAFRSSSELFFDWQPQDDLEWLSQIQHYGGPTSLLDFSNSFWVALYFAVWPHIHRDMTTDFSVLAIRSSCLPDGLAFHHPQRQNARLLAQQGLFLAKTDHERTVDDILSSAGIDFGQPQIVDDIESAKRLLLPDEDDGSVSRVAAIKFCFPHSSNRQVLKYLYQMNITGSSLFPDQEGAIQNLSNEFHLLATMANKRLNPYAE